MNDLTNEIDRFGSSEFAQSADLSRGDFYTQTNSAAFIGFDGNRPLWVDSDGALLLVAGARGGKLRDLLSYNICSGILSGVSLLILDLKGELACISADQTPDKKFCRYWNPSALHDLPQDRLNPVDYIHADSPSLVSDVKVFCENMIALSGSANGEYFERRGREFLEAVILTLVSIKGVLTLPDLYSVLNLIPTNNDAWLDFAFEMTEAGYEISARIEEEIAAARGQSGTGLNGILGEIFKAFSALSDPILMVSVSPPYTMSMADLCDSNQLYQMYLMSPAEFIDPWASVIKAIFVAGMVYKARAPQAPRQTWILDECAQLGKFPLIPKLYSYGAGIGIRPISVWQSTAQMNAISSNAKTVITSSAAVRIYFAIRDIESATDISKMLGAQTLEYDDEYKKEDFARAKKQMAESLLGGGDIMEWARYGAYYKSQAAIKVKQHRHLRTPAEVVNTPPNKMYIFSDSLQKPIYADRKPYYEQKFMAGRYLNNPYHPPQASVRVKTFWGMRSKRIIKSPVPQSYKHYPQYRDGYWRHIER